MYTIRQAATRSGVPAALLRAWERRYRIVVPERTSSGYRLYDDGAIQRLRTMRRLVDSGWSARTAANAILSGEQLPPEARTDASGAEVDPTSAVSRNGELISALLDAAVDLDAEGTEIALDAIFAAGSFEHVTDELLMPALVVIGSAWEDGRLSVAGEHAVSHAVLRRLAAAFQAAGRPARGPGVLLVGMPPGGRHELGALAFAVAARRAGLPVLYLGPDLPLQEWVDTARALRARGAVIGAVVSTDAEPAAAVAVALRAAVPGLMLAFGGWAASGARDRVGTDQGADEGLAPLVLPDGVKDSTERIRVVLRRRS